MNAFRLPNLAPAILALAGCATSADSGPPVRNVQPATVNYDDSVLYEGYPGDLGYAYAGAPVFDYRYGHGYGYDNDGYTNDTILPPGLELICDLSLNICYDRAHLDYFAAP